MNSCIYEIFLIINHFLCEFSKLYEMKKTLSCIGFNYTVLNVEKTKTKKLKKQK